MPDVFAFSSLQSLYHTHACFRKWQVLIERFRVGLRTDFPHAGNKKLQASVVHSQEWKCGYNDVLANAGRHGVSGIAMYVSAYRLGGENTFLRKGSSLPQAPSLSKDFYSRYRVQHWLHQCGGTVPQPALCAIAGIKVFGKRRGFGGREEPFLRKVFSPPKRYAETYIAIPDTPCRPAFARTSLYPHFHS